MSLSDLRNHDDEVRELHSKMRRLETALATARKERDEWRASAIQFGVACSVCADKTCLRDNGCPRGMRGPS